jgi:predicted GNAT family N-acyltransferase
MTKSEAVDPSIRIAVAQTAEEREAVFALRLRVFVEEQNVPVEEELDAYDDVATHFMAVDETSESSSASRIIATARLVDKGDGLGKIGRVAVHAAYRGRGVGAQLMRFIHAFAYRAGYGRLWLEAQCYAIPFYEKLGYVAEGEVFLDASIEHRHMRRMLDSDTSLGRDSTHAQSTAEFAMKDSM